MKGATFSMVENTCGGPAMVAFDHLELLIMSSGINRLRAATAKNAGALNYMLPDFPFRALPTFGDHLALHPISTQAMGYPCNSRYLISAAASSGMLVRRSRPCARFGG